MENIPNVAIKDHDINPLKLKKYIIDVPMDGPKALPIELNILLNPIYLPVLFAGAILDITVFIVGVVRFSPIVIMDISNIRPNKLWENAMMK